MNYALISGWHVHTQGFLNRVPEANCLYVWDTDHTRGKNLADQYASQFQPDLTTILADEKVEAVVIEAATMSHYDLVVAAAEAGKHIFIDKPFTIDEKAALELKAVIAKAGVKFVISLETLVWGGYRQAKKMIDDGVLGEVSSIYFRRTHTGALADWLPAYWYDQNQTGGGVTLDLGCHGLNILPYFLGEPESIHCSKTQMANKGIDDNSTTVMTFANGAIGTAHTSFVADAPANFLEILGSKGYLQVSGAEDNQQLKLHSTTFAGKEACFSNFTNEPYPIEVFQDAVMNNRPVPAEYGIDAAVRLSRIIEACYR
ncbi:putative dehydrogenase [Enterococcus sp. PF1-24]|uniref:Gfo/Idh/MocA family protein n=1 Tax=unclassified Enterococcus TaxID=2608891 RepID=UPI0024750BDA|nr:MULTISPECIES: Gfo/Idh/MocA family oxidoreductase [unclassified Enterococcus]MDH6364384.1 putative dehydrogenase [Enterococcus sp. PFB1-1]MDH6401427.1 putative dehydrogenase [Enterococcus sp. PF1-24]